ncbi:hypothetical protein ACIRG5_16825 [Lentzea sp. NPDC102401]|uniref:hypothetical protein n=1 Tax=Lentzea sp. NPDC102401 TaxID=3364128 RepID=UPI0038156050
MTVTRCFSTRREPRSFRGGEYRYGLDVMAAARELQRLDATSIVAAGAGTGATVVAATAERISGLKGLVLLTPLAITRQGTELDAVAGVRAVEVPSFVAAARDDILADGAHEVAGAASDTFLERWVLPITGVVLLLVVAGVVVLRRRNTTTPPDVSAGS